MPIFADGDMGGGGYTGCTENCPPPCTDCTNGLGETTGGTTIIEREPGIFTIFVREFTRALY
jgi:hypothetical protein